MAQNYVIRSEISVSVDKGVAEVKRFATTVDQAAKKGSDAYKKMGHSVSDLEKQSAAFLGKVGKHVEGITNSVKNAAVSVGEFDYAVAKLDEKYEHTKKTLGASAELDALYYHEYDKLSSDAYKKAMDREKKLADERKKRQEQWIKDAEKLGQADSIQGRAQGDIEANKILAERTKAEEKLTNAISELSEAQQFEKSLQEQLKYFRESNVEQKKIAQYEAKMRSDFVDRLTGVGEESKKSNQRVGDIGTSMFDAEERRRTFEYNLIPVTRSMQEAGKSQAEIDKWHSEKTADYEKKLKKEIQEHEYKLIQDKIERWGNAFSSVADIFSDDWAGLSADLKQNLVGILGNLAGDIAKIFETGKFSFANIGQFVKDNADALAQTAYTLSKLARDQNANQSNTQEKLDKVSEFVSQLGWIGSLIGAGWNLGRGMTEHSRGGTYINGKIVDVGDISTGDVWADPAMTYGTQQLSGNGSFRTAGQMTSAAFQEKDYSEMAKQAPGTFSEWMDPGMGLISNTLTAKFGNTGRWLGSGFQSLGAAGPMGIFGALFGGKKNPEFTLDELAPRFDSSVFGYDVGKGMKAIDTSAFTPEVLDAHWYNQIQSGLYTGINEISAAYSASVNEVMAMFPDEYAVQFEEIIAGFDYGSMIDLNGRYGLDEANEKINDRLQEYQEALQGSIELATARVMKSYISAAGDLGPDLFSTDVAAGIANTQLEKFDDKGNFTGYATEVESAEAAFQRFGEITKYWNDLNDALDGLTAEGLTVYEAALQSVGLEQEAQIATLEQLGFTETALGQIREKQAAYLAQVEAQFAEKRAGILDQAARYSNPLSQTESVVAGVNANFEKLRNELVQAGGSSVDLARLESSRLLTIRYELEKLASAVSDKFASVRASIEQMRFTAGGGTNAGFAMQRFESLLDGPVVTMESMSLAADALNTWYSAATAEAQQQAAAQSQASAAQSQAASGMSNAAGAVSNAADKMDGVARSIENLVRTIDQTINSIKYSSLNVGLASQKRESASEDYAALKAKAVSGGEEEIKAFASFASTYLQQAQADYQSGAEYQAIYAGVMADLEGFKSALAGGDYNSRLATDTADTGGYAGGGYAGGYAGGESAGGSVSSEADLSGINAQYEKMAALIEEKMAALIDNEITINVDWEGLAGDSAAAIAMLAGVVEQYGWNETVTLTFVSELAENFTGTMTDALDVLGYIGTEAGWEARATLDFIANCAIFDTATYEEAMSALNFILDGSGGWNTPAMTTFLGESGAFSSLEYEERMRMLEHVVSQSGGWETTATTAFLGNAQTFEAQTYEQNMAALTFIKDQTGWESKAVTVFLGNAGLFSSADFEQKMAALRMVTDATGWTSDATLNLLANASGFSTEDAERQLEALQFVSDNSGGWGTEAAVGLSAHLLDSGLPWADIEATMIAAGVADAEVVKHVTGVYESNDMTLDELQSMLQDSALNENVIKQIYAELAVTGMPNEIRYVGPTALGYDGPLTIRYDGPYSLPVTGAAASAASGMWNVPYSEMLSYIHGGEIVVRADDAPLVRGFMTAAGMASKYGVPGGVGIPSYSEGKMTNLAPVVFRNESENDSREIVRLLRQLVENSGHPIQIEINIDADGNIDVESLTPAMRKIANEVVVKLNRRPENKGRMRF